MIRKKNTRTVVIVPVASVFLAVILFLALNGPADGAEGPHRTPLTVQFLLSLFAQFVFRDKSGHDHHLTSHGAKEVVHGCRNTARVCFPLTEASPVWYDWSRLLIHESGVGEWLPG